MDDGREPTRLDNGGVPLTFLRTAADTDGAAHVQEARYPARSPAPPAHLHPSQEERFDVTEGTLLFRVAGVERVVRAGERIVIGAGVVHSVRNPGDVPAVALWETRPALRTGAFFVAMDRANRGGGLPRLARVAAVLAAYQDVFVLAAPPRPVQRLLFACLVPFGRREGGPGRAD